MTERHRGRVVLGNRMRALRHDAGLSAKDVAERLAWPASKLSKLEHGRQAASAQDITGWAGAVGVPDGVRDELLADARSLRVEYDSWKRLQVGGFAGVQTASLPLQRATTRLRAFEVGAVPGLLQTTEYARNMFANLMRYRPELTDIDEAVAGRLRRQEVLYEPGKTFEFLVTESALSAVLCPLLVLRAQLKKLLVLGGLNTVELAVIPAEARLPRMAGHGFWIFDDSLVLVETLSAELSLRDADDVELYVRHFERLWEVAETGDDARAVISRVLARLPEPGTGGEAGTGG